MKTQASAGSSATAGAFYALSAALVFSTAGIIVRNIELPAWDMSFWRSLLLIVTILPFLVLHRERTLRDFRRAGLSLVLSALMLAGSAVSFMLALSLAPVANVLIVCGATPFATALLARFFLHEPLHRHTLLAMMAAALGLALSVANSLQAGAFAGMAAAGIVMLCMSGNYVIVRHRRDIAMQPALALTGVFSALIALPFVSFQAVSGPQIGWLLLLGPGQFAFGLLLYVAALKRIPAGRAALLGLLELVFGPIWVWVFDGERPGNWTLLGGLVVISAAAVNVWLDSRLASAKNRT
jgi:drug/metabolite transporter (DMT)-like permease